MLTPPRSPLTGQVIDDSKNVTLVGLGSVSKSVREALGEDGDKKSATKSKDAAAVVGRLLAEKCKEKGIEMVVFDRGGFKYHGRISVRPPHGDSLPTPPHTHTSPPRRPWLTPRARLA